MFVCNFPSQCIYRYFIIGDAKRIVINEHSFAFFQTNFLLSINYGRYLTGIRHWMMRNGLNTPKRIQFIEFLMPKVTVNIRGKILAKDQWPQPVHFGTHIYHDSSLGRVCNFIWYFFRFVFCRLELVF